MSNSRSTDTKLIIIRGPSASGKSTTANELYERSTRPTFLLSADTIRKLFNDHQQPNHLASKRIANQAILIALDNGYDVIYHGILPIIKGKDDRFDELLVKHPFENYFFYLDVGIDETFKRHNTRNKKHAFSADVMREWWHYSSPTQSDIETIISGELTLSETLAQISDIAAVPLKD